VRAVTPAAVLTGVGRLATLLATDQPGAVLVIDVGGATTDVYSAVSNLTAPETHAVALPPDRRTVEGDIGMRWSAPGVLTEAVAERLLTDTEAADLAAPVRHRSEHVEFVPDGADPVDTQLAALAATLAARRHLRLIDGRLGPRGAGLLVLSGGVFRHADPVRITLIADRLRTDPVLRPVLRNATVVVDQQYVLAPAGLLTDAGHTATADALLRNSFA
jgi:hypothetical protein